MPSMHILWQVNFYCPMFCDLDLELHLHEKNIKGLYPGNNSELQCLHQWLFQKFSRWDLRSSCHNKMTCQTKVTSQPLTLRQPLTPLWKFEVILYSLIWCGALGYACYSVYLISSGTWRIHCNLLCQFLKSSFIKFLVTFLFYANSCMCERHESLMWGKGNILFCWLPFFSHLLQY